MSDRKLEMAEAFIRTQPPEAARLIEQLQPEVAASLVHRLHEDVAARLLQVMLPQYVARIIAELDASLATTLLGRMDTSRMVVFLRHLGREARRRIIDSLPTRTQATSSLLLNYGPESVGAWMDAQTITLPEDCLVKEALQRLATETGRQSSGRVFVLNRELRVRGMVEIAQLVRANPENPLLSLLETAPPGIPGRATLLSARDHVAWNTADVVAVLNRNRQFVGALTHARMRQGLRELSTGLREPRGADPVTGIAEVYGSTLFALLESVGQASGLTAPEDSREGRR